MAGLKHPQRVVRSAAEHDLADLGGITEQLREIVERRPLVIDRQTLRCRSDSWLTPPAPPRGTSASVIVAVVPRPRPCRSPARIRDRRSSAAALDVRDPHPVPLALEQGLGALLVHPDAVVGDAQLHVLPDLARGDLDPPLATAFDPVSDRVLDERLQREHGNDSLQHLGRHLKANLQEVAEAGALEPKVLLDVVELIGEGDIGALTTECIARELGELREQLTCLLGLGADVSGDRGERVVDEVRGDLSTQRAELSVRQRSDCCSSSASSSWAETRLAASATVRVSSGDSRHPRT